MGRASGGVKRGIRRRGNTWQDCCEARHVKKFLTSGLEACLLSLSLAPARQHIFHSPLDWAGAVAVEAESVGIVVLCIAGLGGRTGLAADVHELWLSVFLKVLRATPRRRGTFISFNFLEIFFSPLYNFLPFAFFLSSLRWRLEDLGLGLGLLFAFFSLERVLSSF